MMDVKEDTLLIVLKPAKVVLVVLVPAHKYAEERVLEAVLDVLMIAVVDVQVALDIVADVVDAEIVPVDALLNVLAAGVAVLVVVKDVAILLLVLVLDAIHIV